MQAGQVVAVIEQTLACRQLPSRASAAQILGLRNHIRDFRLNRKNDSIFPSNRQSLGDCFEQTMPGCRPGIVGMAAPPMVAGARAGAERDNLLQTMALALAWLTLGAAVRYHTDHTSVYLVMPSSSIEEIEQCAK